MKFLLIFQLIKHIIVVSLALKIQRVLERAYKAVYYRPNLIDKIVLCRPKGGLNDMLCQIQKCRLYAIKSNRNLWVDARQSGFHDCLSQYFEACQEIHFGFPTHLSDKDISCFPNCLTGKIDSYESIFDHTLANFVDKDTREPLTFDFDLFYFETILLHEQCGGGVISIGALEQLQLKQPIKHEINSILQTLGEYDAIHIRNTNYTTDYRSFFNRIKHKLNRKVVVCTDDFNCQQYAQKFWGTQLVTVTQPPNTGGRPLHKIEFEYIERQRLNIEVLIDLFVLASAQRFYKCNTREGLLSGFSMLVELLRSNPKVLNKLLV